MNLIPMFTLPTYVCALCALPSEGHYQRAPNKFSQVHWENLTRLTMTSGRFLCQVRSSLAHQVSSGNASFGLFLRYQRMVEYLGLPLQHTSYEDWSGVSHKSVFGPHWVLLFLWAHVMRGVSVFRGEEDTLSSPFPWNTLVLCQKAPEVREAAHEILVTSGVDPWYDYLHDVYHKTPHLGPFSRRLMKELLPPQVITLSYPVGVKTGTWNPTEDK